MSSVVSAVECATRRAASRINMNDADNFFLSGVDFWAMGSKLNHIMARVTCT